MTKNQNSYSFTFAVYTYNSLTSNLKVGMLPAEFCCRPCHYNYWINVDQKIASGKMPLSWEICLIGNYSRELDDDFLFHDDLAVTPTHTGGLCKRKRKIKGILLH